MEIRIDTLKQDAEISLGSDVAGPGSGHDPVIFTWTPSRDADREIELEAG